jgi:zinc-ribbon domain
MFCPNCGAENDAGNRFCVNCGTTLSQKPAGAPAPSPGERLKRLLGSNRRARLLSAATAIAIIVAIVAFVALDPGEESGAQDTFLSGLDRSCVAEKERVSRLETETLRRSPPDLAEFATVLVTIVAEWRASLEATPPPAIHAAGVEALDQGLREVLIEAGGLARLVRGSAPANRTATKAAEVDDATAAANRMIEDLGLDDCADIAVAAG